MRRAGDGRKRADLTDPTLRHDLERLVKPLGRGRSGLAATLDLQEHAHAGRGPARAGPSHQVVHVLVAEWLHELGYSLQANRKTLESTQHVDRNTQFEHLNARVERYQTASEPESSVDAKKKEPNGRFKNTGQTWCPAGALEAVNDHDFAEARAILYGIYD